MRFSCGEHRQAYDNFRSQLQQAPALMLMVDMMPHAGVIILLFLAGLLPFSSVVFLLLGMCALSSYIQYIAIVRQGPERQPSNATGLPAQLFPSAERNRHVAILSMMGTVGMDDLRLSLMNRDFNESGKVIQPAIWYALLVLGSFVYTSRQHTCKLPTTSSTVFTHQQNAQITALS